MTAIEPIVGRYLTSAIGRAPASALFRGGGRGHSARLPAHRRRRRPPVPPPDEDAEITAHFRVLAFDMPWHGKSLPPDGFQDEEYRLTTAAYTEMMRRLLRARSRSTRPVVHGLFDRRAHRAAISRSSTRAEFRALIGLESADFQRPGTTRPGSHRPDVHGGEVCAALVSGLMAPQSPEASRHETLWMYMQGGPGVFKGDLYFYRVDGDLRGQGRRHRHRASARSICSPASTISPARRRTRSAPPRTIPGARGDGHGASSGISR